VEGPDAAHSIPWILCVRRLTLAFVARFGMLLGLNVTFIAMGLVPASACAFILGMVPLVIASGLSEITCLPCASAASMTGTCR